MRRRRTAFDIWEGTGVVSGWLAGGPVPTMAAVSRPLTKVVVPCPIWRPARGSSPQNGYYANHSEYQRDHGCRHDSRADYHAMLNILSRSGL